MKKDLKYCTHCHLIHDRNEIKRQYGKESAVYLGGFHSAECYTKHTMKKKKDVYVPINYIPVSDGILPEATKRAEKETYIRGASDRVLVFCKDGHERFGRYIHGSLISWNVEGCCGQPDDFVTHFAYLTNPEEN